MNVHIISKEFIFEKLITMNDVFLFKETKEKDFFSTMTVTKIAKLWKETIQPYSTLSVLVE